jgi:glycosyltransferase involved in cell wall biosynthesis
MTQTLLNGLSQRAEFMIKHIDTQVSRSLAEKGGRHQLRKSLKGFAQAARLVFLMLSFRPDIVYLPLTNSPSFLGFLRDTLFIVPAMLFHKRVVIRLHGGYYFYSHTRGTKRRLVNSVLGRVSLAMVQGQRLTSAFDGLVSADRIAVIPNGLDDAPFVAARARRVNTALSRRRILFVGLMCREKGFHDMLAAIPFVPEADFVFLGEWPSHEVEREAREFLKEKGVEERVLFAGVVAGPTKYDLFIAADIFVFPTYFAYEGHAVSSVEALAAGLPIICTDHGALDESVRDGWNGYFVPRSDPEASARRVNELLGDDNLRRTMGRRSRQLYEERFTLQKFIDNWVQAIHHSNIVPSKKGYRLL